jgi:hypothetical protein
MEGRGSGQTPMDEENRDSSSTRDERERGAARESARMRRAGLLRGKITHVVGASVALLVLYVISIPLASLRTSADVDKEVEETSRLLVALSTKSNAGGYNKTNSRGDGFTRVNRTKMDRPQLSSDLRLKSPFGAVIAGPSGAGKSVVMERLIERRDTMCDNPPEEVIYCYGSWQPAFERMRNVTFHEGLIDFKAGLPSDGKPRWLIIDDLMSESSANEDVDDLFTKHSHHKNISVFVLVQNFFHKGFRTITLNAHYLFLFKNPRDASQVGFLARQLFPENPNFLIESYKDATAKPHSFLAVDLKQNTSEDLRVLGNFLPSDPSDPIVAYTPK